MLRAGRCVAFPTETVYGLGANALSEEAVLRVFEYKGRPLTDPLIVHVAEAADALELVELHAGARAAFEALTAAFWPGPLTLVSRAKGVIPSKVTAGTGFVGVRMPNHPLALALIRAAGVPVAAPSANRFGHVSPTRSVHVLDDLGQHPIGILDGDGSASLAVGGLAAGDTGAGTDTSAGAGSDTVPCAVGIESTVAKIDGDTGEMIVYRRGGVSVEAIEAALAAASITMPIRIVSKAALAKDDASKGLEAPGQLLTHYAPDVQTMMVVPDPRLALGSVDAGGDGDADAGAAASPDDGGDGERGPDVADCVVIDFGGRLSYLRKLALAYQSLSEAGDVIEARSRVFDTLRWAEGVAGARGVLLADLGDVTAEHADAVRDRLYRAASGRRVVVDPAELTTREAPPLPPGGSPPASASGGDAAAAAAAAAAEGAGDA